jgi:diguanylate cyclase (GGDEF)-like protein
MVAAVLRTNLRPTDLYARYGGEEFSMLLSGISVEDSIITAERLRKAVADEEIKDRNGITLNSVTISIGIAKFRENESMDDLIDRADQYLYKAKANGKNCIYHEMNNSGN